MTPGHQVDTTWMWHPGFTEDRTETAGLFVHFRKALLVEHQAPSLRLVITADTRYKLFVNQALVSFGPVKGDFRCWFYDEVDIGPYLRRGSNAIFVTVLRFFYATSYATSFPRLPFGGLRITTSDPQSPWRSQIESSPAWHTAIDRSTILRVDEPEDDFLHVYEHVSSGSAEPVWVPARLLRFQTSTGNSAPWNLSPRQIPPPRLEQQYAFAVHNVQSDIPLGNWEALLIGSRDIVPSEKGIRLAPLTKHRFDLEMHHHLTAFLAIHFARPVSRGSTLRVKYAESYEDTPRHVPYLRTKGDRRDLTKDIHGPEDIYEFQGPDSIVRHSLNDIDIDKEESLKPFHFRTFRFIQVQIDVGADELVLKRVDIESVLYPLDVVARLQVPTANDLPNRLWATSVRTLNNCMHDCYEDCPFYEQLQYAMDTRSSALFTYYASGDDRLARQAMTQIHDSFNPRLGLTCSRAPSHKPQVIPHFSLYWVCLLNDHLTFYGDKPFIRKFTPVVDAVLAYFDLLLDQGLGLVRVDDRPGVWNYTDWAKEWQPYGIPPAAERTGVSTYTNCLYAYTLKRAALMLRALGRSAMGVEYLSRAIRVAQAVHTHCFDGKFYTDGLAAMVDESTDYSQHSQVWAILSGAATPEHGQVLLRACLDPTESARRFVGASISMSHYTLRALSEVGGSLYEQQFHSFWKPWEEQLALNLTTWEEDSVSQRSDCHAWGSAPIFEFMAEVVGLRPLEAGWSAILFQPRLGLYPELQATVPLRGSRGKVEFLAHVSWKPTPSGETMVRLNFETSASASIPVVVKLPAQPERMTDSTTNIEALVKT